MNNFKKVTKFPNDPNTKQEIITTSEKKFWT